MQGVFAEHVPRSLARAMSDPTNGAISVERREGMAVVTMRRAPVNGLTPAFVAELDGVRRQLEADGVAAAVLESGVAGTFCAGADATWVAQRTDALGPDAFVAEFEAFTGALTTLAHAMRDGPVLWIAAIGGHCVAGGLELALACDVRICAAEGITFSFPELRMFGASPTGAGALQELVRAAGRSRTLLLVTTGERFGPEQAQAWRLVDEVVPSDALAERGRALATTIAAAPVADAIAQLKAALRGADLPLDDARALDRTTFVEQLHGPAFAAGLDAFARRFGRSTSPSKGKT
jgi:enoyl-CoA hydratase/carnithine racemase